MAFSSPPNFTSSLHLTLLFFLFFILLSQVEGQPTRQRTDTQVLQDLLGVKISSLVLGPSAIIEGSADSTPPLSQNGRDHRVELHMFLDFLRRQRKMGGRSRKGVARGCFGMKVDRIGVISGLGC